MLAYVCDPALREELNERQRNYWDVYFQEILDLLGVRGRALALTELENPASFRGPMVLMVGMQSGQRLSRQAIDRINAWVREGGVLIGCGVAGLDDVFGIRCGEVLRQEPDEYSISGLIDLYPHDLTHEVHPVLFQDQKLLVLSDVQKAAIDTAVELGRLFSPDGEDLGCPAIAWHACGKGFAGYFAFDLAKTVWILHQGRPLPPPTAERPLQRGGDTQVQGSHSRKIAYADELCLILQNMLAQAGLAFIHPIPPAEGKVADAILYYGGDEYQGPTELSVKASDWMKAHGMGYHINMEERHPITPEELRHILDNGHEVSLYYDLYRDGKVMAMEEQTYLDLAEKFFRKFGFRPGVTVNHWLRWRGWAEPARWMLKAGGKADNSFTATPIPMDHPSMNGPVYGFGQGTGYPFYFYDDYRGGNERIEFMEQPIICYEIGHRGSIQDYRTDAAEEVHLPVDMAIKYHMILNFFYHPNCVANFPLCQNAIEEILRYIRHRGATVLHWGNDRVADWWAARRRAGLEGKPRDDSAVSFVCECDWPEGMAVKMLLKRPIDRVTLESPAGWRPATWEVKHEFAGDWLYVIVPTGRFTITIHYEWSVHVHSVIHRKKRSGQG